MGSGFSTLGVMVPDPMPRFQEVGSRFSAHPPPPTPSGSRLGYLPACALGCCAWNEPRCVGHLRMSEISPNGALLRPVFFGCLSEKVGVSFQQRSPESALKGGCGREFLLGEVGGQVSQLQQHAVTGVHAEGQVDDLILPVVRQRR